jgi:hypothetical protein
MYIILLPLAPAPLTTPRIGSLSMSMNRIKQRPSRALARKVQCDVIASLSLTLHIPPDGLRSVIRVRVLESKV